MATKAAGDKVNKPLAFTASDPRGNIVICAQSVWDSHIVKGHPEMDGRLTDVHAAIINPDAIRESTARADAQVFEWVAADTVQIRVAVTFDDVSLVQDGQTIAKVNSAFPVDPTEYDRPRVGNYVYRRTETSNEGGQEGNK